ncbi:hypothetical protein C7450_105377 [Chelatococcus asaccharovorans]|uniref:Uncharacterized protein n=1 Tax=Chelatococcus asaccharovorans TaxID=28210 RepID=A0A2V3UJ60_9HYPH|nr:hypothetical protein C7450_105377 [Chelatococcus asaccharovorans]
MSQRICGEAVSFRPVVTRAAAPLGPSPSVADLLRLRIGGQIHRLGWYRTIPSKPDLPSRICSCGTRRSAPASIADRPKPHGADPARGRTVDPLRYTKSVGSKGAPCPTSLTAVAVASGPKAKLANMRSGVMWDATLSHAVSPQASGSRLSTFS